jgi:hypothetical protein
MASSLIDVQAVSVPSPKIRKGLPALTRSIWPDRDLKMGRGAYDRIADSRFDQRLLEDHIGALEDAHRSTAQEPRAVLGRQPAADASARAHEALHDLTSAQQRAHRGLPTPDIAQQGIAYVSESMGIFTDLTVQENMLLAARGACHADELNADRLAWVFGLSPRSRPSGCTRLASSAAGRNRCWLWGAPSSSRAN